MIRRRARGFTLLELLVAIAIFAIFSAVAYGGLRQVLHTRERLQAEQQFWRQLGFAFLRMQTDLALARPRRIRDVDGSWRPAFLGQPTDTRPEGPPSLAFTRGGVLVIGPGPHSDLQRVGYRLVGHRLERITWPVLDRAPQTRPAETTLLDHVEEFRVRFYPAAGGELLDVWPAPGITDVLPRGVEVTLVIAGRGTFTRLFRVNG